MEAFIASGRAADLILAVVAVEAVILAVWARARLSRAAIGAMLAPGVCLVLAVRFAVTDAGWVSVAAALAASFVTHGVDVAFRLRGATERAGERKTPGAA